MRSSYDTTKCLLEPKNKEPRLKIAPLGVFFMFFFVLFVVFVFQVLVSLSLTVVVSLLRKNGASL